MTRDNLDMLIDQLLREQLGGDRPRDLTARILSRAAVFDIARRRRRLSLGAAVAAAIALAAILWTAWPKEYPGPRIVDGEVIVDNGGPLVIGNSLHTDVGARLALGGYVQAHFEPGSAWTLGGTRLHEQVLLDRGEMEAQVTKKRGTFDVLVGPARVHVIGTLFRLNVHDFGDSKQLTVNVTEGRVQVDTPEMREELAAGQAKSFTFDAQPASMSPLLADSAPLASEPLSPSTAAPQEAPPEIAADDATALVPPAASSTISSTTTHPAPPPPAATRGSTSRERAVPPSAHGTVAPPARQNRTREIATRPAASPRASSPPKTPPPPPTRTFVVVRPPPTGRLIMEGKLIRDQEYLLLETPRGTFLLFVQQAVPPNVPINARVRVVWENGKPTITRIEEPPARAR